MSVGALITWPYKAGDRSRRGSPKAGTTVVLPGVFCSTSPRANITLSGKKRRKLLKQLKHMEADKNKMELEGENNAEGVPPACNNSRVQVPQLCASFLY